MASKRCGCASDSCTCVITGGQGVEVSGLGSKTNPYVIDASVAPSSLTVQDENTLVRAGVTQLDFQGQGVVTTPGDAGEVIVTISGGVVTSYPLIRVKGRYVPAFPIGSYTPSVGIANNRKTYFPMDLTSPLTIDRWAVAVGTQGVGGTQTINVGLYATDPDTGYPMGSDLYAIAAASAPVSLTVPVANTLAQSAVFAAPITIPIGRYWVAVHTVLAGQTTIAAIPYISGWDPRVPVTTAVASIGYSSGLLENGSPTSAGGAVGTFPAGSSFYGVAVLWRLA